MRGAGREPHGSARGSAQPGGKRAAGGQTRRWHNGARPSAALVGEMMTLMLRSGGRDVPFAQLHEARRLLEVEFAGLAAERHSAQDLAAIEQQLRLTEEHTTDAERWAQADVDFHAAIAAATHNPIYQLLLGSIADLLIEVRRTGATLPETAQKAYQHHSAIYARIAARDRVGARQAMHDHLQESEETFQRARFSQALGGDI
ncbi:FadR family transcriptional regulator [Candidatus Gracilibacteria bacterium]|nr:FadR family transcriptional regulator [Candidatus Gracilibacteria bacterium]